MSDRFGHGTSTMHKVKTLDTRHQRASSHRKRRDKMKTLDVRHQKANLPKKMRDKVKILDQFRFGVSKLIYSGTR